MTNYLQTATINKNLYFKNIQPQLGFQNFNSVKHNFESQLN